MCSSIFSKPIIAITLTILLITGCSGATPSPTVEIQPTVTRFPPSATSTTLPANTIIPSYTPTSVTSSIYYMIVLDASEKMNASFDGKTKWDAARASAQAIVNGLEPGANFGLVVIGGSAASEGADACTEPSVVRTPFSARQNIDTQISQLQPAGRGSLSAALALARNQFEGLSPNTIRVLILITGSEDNCQSEEWSDLEKQFKVKDEAGVDSHTEIVIVDEEVNPNIKAVAERVGLSSTRVNFQMPQASALLNETNAIVIGNVKNYVDYIIATKPTETPVALSPTPTPDLGLPTNTLSASSFTLTPRPGALTSTLSASSYTLTPKFSTPTVTPSMTLTPGVPTIVLSWTPSISPVPPSSTPVSPTTVNLLSVTYLTLGTGCQIDVQVRVTGGPAIGTFHVRNDSYAPGDNSAYPQTTLQVGTNWASSFSYSNQITLNGSQPAYFQHEVWFEYNGVQSNHLANLVCPGIPPP